MVKEIKVAVHGSYFADNYGDTLLVKIMCDKVASIVGVENVFQAVEGHKKEQARIGYPVARASDRSKVTHLIYGGGGYLGERGRGSLDNLVWSSRNFIRHIVWKGKYAKARKAIVGAGFGPISNLILRRMVCRLAQGAEIVLLRDKESLAFLHQYGVTHGNAATCVDLALSLPRVERERVGVALHAENLSEEEMRIVFSSIRQVLDKTAVSVIFDNVGGDTPENRRKYEAASLLAGISEISFHPYVGVDETLAEVTKYELVITSKLHVGITTIAQGGRVISIPSHQKTVRLYRQLGIDKFCILRSCLTEASLSATMNSLEEFAPNKQVVKSGLDNVDDALRKFLS